MVPIEYVMGLHQDKVVKLLPNYLKFETTHKHYVLYLCLKQFIHY